MTISSEVLGSQRVNAADCHDPLVFCGCLKALDRPWNVAVVPCVQNTDTTTDKINYFYTIAISKITRLVSCKYNTDQSLDHHSFLYVLLGKWWMGAVIYWNMSKPQWKHRMYCKNRQQSQTVTDSVPLYVLLSRYAFGVLAMCFHFRAEKWMLIRCNKRGKNVFQVVMNGGSNSTVLPVLLITSILTRWSKMQSQAMAEPQLCLNLDIPA